MKKALVVTVVVGTILAGISCAGGGVELPEGAQQLSDIIPTMGEHWADPADLPLGPIYLVHDGEVVGMEYMWSEEMLQPVSIPTPEGMEEFFALQPLDVSGMVDHFDVALMPHGHDGFEVPHWDIHVYFISLEEQAEIVPHDH